MRLTLAELRSAASGLETVLLPLLGAGIPGEHASYLEGGAIFASLQKSAGDAKADSLGLASEATTLGVHFDVIFAINAQDGQGLLEVHDEGGIGEVVIDIASIDGDLALAGEDVNAGDR